MARVAFLKQRITSDEGGMNYANASGSAISEGQPVSVNIGTTQCIAGVTLDDIANGTTGRIDITSVYAFPCAAGTTYAAGAQVYWDYEGSKAIPAASSNGSSDFCLGTAVRARAATDPA
jgi:predicted RecA/RadA family phage recombinase